MLDRSALILQINQLASKLFPDLKSEFKLAQEKWKEISNDSVFIQKVESSKSTFLIPKWIGNLSDSHKITDDLKEYSVLSVDGSQIYPDRNISGSGCYLVNTGGCFVDYKNSNILLFSEPQIFLIHDFFKTNYKITFTKDLVDLKREELELKNLLSFAQKNNNPICFIDGTVIFWSLESKQEELKNLFLNSYINYLNQFYEQRILVAGYISFPKSRELVNLIKLGLCRFTEADCISCHGKYDFFPCKQIDNLIDTQIVKFFLKPNCRSTIFWSKSKIIQEYPQHLKPCFFYLNLGQEIIRIETFAWIVQEPSYLDLICKVAIDQAKKGQGYPVVLAEAHEQAVVKGVDRDFFYYLIQKVSIDQKKRVFYSQKSLKKRFMGV